MIEYQSNWVFVFGSNLAGRHGKGAAKYAKDYCGAICGQGIGRQGNSYAIPTKDHNLNSLDLNQIEKYVKDFLEYARQNPNEVFYVTRIGCGLAGYTDAQIKPMFDNCPSNLILTFKGADMKQIGTKGTFLSNMYPCKIKIDGDIFECSEALFQSFKTADPEQIKQFVGIDGYTAKRLGKKVSLIPNWNEKRVGFMQFALKEKFEQNPELKQMLLATGNDEIVEFNTWNDTFWGVCNGVGQNMLGKCLMALRRKFKPAYAGIGSRETPTHILKFMTYIARCVEQNGYVLRSGGAIGADTAFETGVSNEFNKCIYTVKNTEIKEFAAQSVKMFHPRPDLLKPYTFHLMARNCYQIIGYDGDSPVERVICYTNDGCESGSTRTIKTGGTGQAISIASHLNIQIDNLGNPETLNKLLKEFNYELN